MIKYTSVSPAPLMKAWVEGEGGDGQCCKWRNLGLYMYFGAIEEIVVSIWSGLCLDVGSITASTGLG